MISPAETAKLPADMAKLLEQLPLFYDFSHHEVRKVAQYAESATFEPRQCIYRAGDSGDRLYFLISGLVRLADHGSVDIQTDDFIIRSRSVFGEDCAVDETPRSLAAEALMRSVCVTLTAHGLRKLEDEHPRIALKLLRKLARVTSLRLKQALGQRNRQAEAEREPAIRFAAPSADPQAGRFRAAKRLISALWNHYGPKAVQPA
jgi:CRP/FNR family transcriptional regulator